MTRTCDIPRKYLWRLRSDRVLIGQRVELGKNL
jgi:hypothetical protein